MTKLQGTYFVLSRLFFKRSLKCKYSKDTYYIKLKYAFKILQKNFNILIACCLTNQEIETRLFLWYKTLLAL